jgi:uncharacterized protein (UPF0332 family)
MEYNLKGIIENLIQKSEEALISAEFNFQNEHYETCQNRLYYAIFYIVSTLAYKDNFITSKHAQLMGWFNKKYIYENKIFETRMFAIYKEAFTNRQKSDYDFTYKPEKDEIIALIEDAKFFTNRVISYLTEEGVIG